MMNRATPLRRLALGLLFLLLCSLADARPKAGTPQVPPIRLDEGLVLSECDGKAAGPDVPAFPSDARCVESVLRLLHVSGRHRVRFFYYDPQGNLYAATLADWALQPAKPGGYHKNGWVRHRLPVAGQRASTLRGQWKVAVWLDGQTVSEKLFRLEGPQTPEDPILAEARRLYLDLRYEEAEQKLLELAGSASGPAVRADACWWLAVVRSALESDGEAVREPLRRLLELDPTYSVTGAAARDAGAEAVLALLEELRGREFPGLYDRTTPLPVLELSNAEEPPSLGKRQRWYQKWWLYAGLAAVAVPVTAVLATGPTTSVPEAPTVSLDLMDGPREPQTSILCAGEIGLRLGVVGGRPPYELIVTVAEPSGEGGTLIQGITTALGRVEIVALRHRIDAEGSAVVRCPKISVGRDTAVSLRFVVTVKDSASSGSFDRAVVGLPVPVSIQELSRSDPRIVRQERLEALTFCL